MFQRPLQWNQACRFSTQIWRRSVNQCHVNLPLDDAPEVVALFVWCVINDWNDYQRNLFYKATSLYLALNFGSIIRIVFNTYQVSTTVTQRRSQNECGLSAAEFDY